MRDLIIPNKKSRSANDFFFITKFPHIIIITRYSSVFFFPRKMISHYVLETTYIRKELTYSMISIEKSASAKFTHRMIFSVRQRRSVGTGPRHKVWFAAT